MEARQLVLLALLIALSMGLHVVESSMPVVMPMPGIKLGLANIVTVICLFIFSAKEAIVIVILRLILVGIAAGTLFTPSFWISCGGGLASLIIMIFAKGLTKLSPIGISLLGAMSHNLGQLMVVSLIMSSQAVFYYLPWLIVWAIPMGLITGFSAKAAIKALRNAGVNDTMRSNQ